MDGLVALTGDDLNVCFSHILSSKMYNLFVLSMVTN